MFRSRMKLARSVSLLGLESHQVITLRLAKLAKGGRAAQTEAHRMVAEKITAAQAAALNLAMGGRAGFRSFTRIRDAVAALPVERAVLDGEAIVLRPDNTSDFG